MKLKYKKAVLIASFSVLCVGAAVYSVRDNGTGDKEKEVLKETVSSLPELVVTSTPELLVSPEPAVLKLEKNAYPEINQLVQGYFDAKVNCDIESLKTLISDAESISKEQLEQEHTYIEGYENTDCYTVKGLEDNSYIVFAYSELKLSGVDTLAPGLTELYVCENKDKKLIIYTGIMDMDHTNYKKKAEQLEEVQELIQTSNAKFEEAKQNDKTLDDLFERIQGSAKE